MINKLTHKNGFLYDEKEVKRFQLNHVATLKRHGTVETDSLYDLIDLSDNYRMNNVLLKVAIGHANVIHETRASKAFRTNQPYGN